MGARNDYAKKTTSRGGPRKSNGKQSGNNKPVPGWVWLLAGLSIGLFIAFLVSISEPSNNSQTTDSVEKKRIKKSNGRADPRQSTPKNNSKSEGVKFDFYHILPEMEVAIPKDEIRSGVKIQAAATQYIIQVGSFKSEADAESRRAQLFLLNFEPSVQKVTIDGKQSWHRVRLGPFVDRRKLDLAQRRLQNSDIEFITLKERN